MLFTEPTFLFLFLPVLLALYFATFKREHGSYANSLLLIASVIFYAKGGGPFTWRMLASIAFNYWMGIAVHRARRPKRVLAFAVTVNLVVFDIFKYANFFADNVNTMNRLLVILFVLVISLPLAANIAGVDGADPGAENRELAPFPHLDGTLKSIADSGGHQGSRRLVLLRRGRIDRGLLPSRSADAAGAAQLAHVGRTRARLAARSRDRVRVFRRAG